MSTKPSTVALGCLVSVALLHAAGAAAQKSPGDPGYLDRELARQARGIGAPHMPEADRDGIEKVIVISGRSEAGSDVDGTYGKETLGIPGGMEAGRRMGTLGKEIGGVPIYFPIPGTAIPGAILGGLFGLTQEQVQAFRDRLTEDLVESDSPPLRSDGLAIDAFWEIRRRSDLDSHLFSTNLEIPEDADAVLYSDFEELSIDVQGKDAVITTSINARLYRPELNRDVYRTKISYQDRDTLKNWTEDDNARWRSYQNFARYYLGREIALDVLNRIEIDRELMPEATGDTGFVKRKDLQHLKTESAQPTLTWRHVLGDAGTDASMLQALESADLRFDLEVFDDRQLVYDAQEIAGTSYTISYPLEACRTYRWSVRPVYLMEDGRRFGEWMRFAWQPEPEKRRGKKKSKKELEAEAKEAREARLAFGKGLMGRRISEAHAYTQDFATLQVACD